MIFAIIIQNDFIVFSSLILSLFFQLGSTQKHCSSFVFSFRMKAQDHFSLQISAFAVKSILHLNHSLTPPSKLHKRGEKLILTDLILKLQTSKRHFMEIGKRLQGLQVFINAYELKEMAQLNIYISQLILQIARNSLHKTFK